MISGVLKRVLKIFLQIAIFVIIISLFLGIGVGVYYLGILKGYQLAQEDAKFQLSSIIESFTSIKKEPSATASPTPRPTLQPKKEIVVLWGGPELWQAVNEKRIELGVNPLSQKDELCTIASIRLNELIDLGTLDAHKGFGELQETRADLKWIFDRYSTIAEFLAVGGKTPEETVALWENTLGHKKLLTGGEYVWGCIYAQNTFAVAITAF